MSGYTGFSVGMVRDTVTFIPVQTLKERGMNRVDMTDRTWLRLMSLCNQKPMLNSDETRQICKERNEKAIRDKIEIVSNIKRRVKNEFNKSYTSLLQTDSNAHLLDKDEVLNSEDEDDEQLTKGDEANIQL
mmetsp:Transcript_48110/g.35310  ORF Transcript_48110/g.35310 Transcript_48110/m.35310 type:complete len:131 (+) Transcript_48110:914-1306(+)